MDSYCAEFENKRVLFRKYLEEEGFVEALGQAFSRLYGESEVPDDAILYVRQWICEKCATEEQYEQMKVDLKEAYSTVAQLEREAEIEKNLLDPSDEDVEAELKEAYKSLQEDSSSMSMLKRNFNQDVIEKHIQSRTKEEPTTRLYHCIKPGIEYPDDPIGLYPANAECYTLFDDMFLPVIREYHDKPPQPKGRGRALQPKLDFGDPEQIINLDSKKKVITNTFISLSRNVNGVPFLSRISYDKCIEFEGMMAKALPNLEGDFGGAYRTLYEIDLDEQKAMADRKVLFKRDNPYLESLGTYHYHPFGRGVYLNDKETFGVWVNAQDHVTIFSKEANGNLGKCYRRVIQGSEAVEKTCKLKYANHKNYGFLTQSIENLGTGMLVSVDMKMPLLQEHGEYLEIMAHDLGVKLKGVPTPEDLKEKDMSQNIITVTNKNVLGVTEIAIITTMQEAISQLVNTELSLAKGAKLKSIKL